MINSSTSVYLIWTQYIGLSISSGVMDVGLSLRGGVVGNITCRVMDIRNSQRVDLTTVKGSVGVRNYWESVAIWSHDWMVKSRVDYRGGHISGAGQGTAQDGEEESETLHRDDCQA